MTRIVTKVEVSIDGEPCVHLTREDDTDPRVPTTQQHLVSGTYREPDGLYRLLDPLVAKVRERAEALKTLEYGDWCEDMAADLINLVALEVAPSPVLVDTIQDALLSCVTNGSLGVYALGENLWNPNNGLLDVTKEDALSLLEYFMESNSADSEEVASPDSYSDYWYVEFTIPGSEYVTHVVRKDTLPRGSDDTRALENWFSQTFPDKGVACVSCYHDAGEGDSEELDALLLPDG